MIEQGTVFWVDLSRPFGSEPGFRRPCLVVQGDTFNRSRLNTTIVCTITTNLRLAAMPGNVGLDPGEGGLTEASVVNVTQVITVDRQRLREQIGVLSAARLDEVLRGLALVFRRALPL